MPENSKVKINQYPVTFFKLLTNTTPDEILTLEDLLTRIKDHDSFSNELRLLYKSNKAKYDREKKDLPGFVLGSFSERKDSSCDIYSSCLAFDIDGIESVEEMKKLLEITKSIDYVFSSFPSVSGHGLRILVLTMSTLGRHKDYYNYVLKELSNDLGKTVSFKLDKSTKNVSRLWYYAPVPKTEYYENYDAVTIFHVPSDMDNKPSKKTNISARIESISTDQQIDLIFEIVRKRNISGRNNFTMEYTRLAAECGVPKEYIISKLMYLIAKDFDEKELTTTVNSNYLKSIYKYNDAQLKSYSKSTIGEEETNRILSIKDRKIEVKEEEKENAEKQPKFVRIIKYLESKYELRRNEVSLDIEVRKKPDPFFDELNHNDFACELMENGFNSIDSMLKVYLSSSKINSYNPLKDYLNSCPKWEPGKPDYINQLASYVHAQDQEWFDKQFKKMLVRALACSLGYIPFNKQVFTLLGKQNDGKTSFLRFLTPKALESYYTENLRLDKDGLISLCQNIFINLDEIASIPYKDRDKIKSLVTAATIKERLPYATKSTKIKRIANFLASTNEDGLLTDDTGNVRWMIFKITGINHDNGGINGYSKNIDVDNVYAQAFYLLQNGFKFKLSSDDIKKSESENINYVKSFSEMEILQSHFKPDIDKKSINFRTNTDLLVEIRQMYPDLKHLSSAMLGKGLNHLGYEKSSKYITEKKGSVKGYFLQLLTHHPPKLFSDGST